MNVAEVVERKPRNRLLRWMPARHFLHGRLKQLEYGVLHMIDARGEHRFGRPDTDGLEATIEIRDPSCYARVLMSGALGAAESYLAGEWETEDLVSVVRLLARNQDVLQGFDRGGAQLILPIRRLAHALRRNTRRGSQRNIMAHYDLGNDFFSLFLDRNLMYSCAIFEDERMSLDDAAEAKLERVCQKLDLVPRDHVLEIGTGWGGFALYAARKHGCRVTTTTISPAQAHLARQRIREAGLEDRVTVLEKDYRHLEGSFDKLVSIEMIEAVGLDNLSEFFRACAARLRDDGLMLLQAITIADRHFVDASQSVDFIQRYIFPGSALPSVGALTEAIAKGSDFTAVQLEDIGLHYAETLRLWRERFEMQIDTVRELGFGERFERMWRYYFCYCEGGFLERSISDVQVLLARSRHRGPYPLQALVR
ncbi:MAG: cyclopropane-fatty-acyl-phospholipid synthase family protein [Acidobacteriota bacterium]